LAATQVKEKLDAFSYVPLILSGIDNNDSLKLARMDGTADRKNGNNSI